MALSASLTPLIISLTQGGADAFVQSSVQTGLTGRQAYNVKAFMVDFTNIATQAGIAADHSIEVSITRRSKTAIATLADSDVLFRYAFAVEFTTSGVAYIPGVIIYVPQLEVPIVEETIYAQLDSTGSTLTNTAVVRMDVELDTMSDIDRLNLITRSLT